MTQKKRVEDVLSACLDEIILALHDEAPCGSEAFKTAARVAAFEVLMLSAAVGLLANDLARCPDHKKEVQ